jgi:hypothetical protein
MPTLLAGIDAETRHAVHNNFLYAKGQASVDLATRAYLVLTEIIDEGKILEGTPVLTPHFDPFLEELDLATIVEEGKKDSGETTGHDGAGYFCKHLLSEDNAKKRQQLNWLIRMKLREKDAFADVAKLNEVKGRLEWTTQGWDGKSTPYTKGLGPLIDFYAMSNNVGPIQNTYTIFAREKLLQHFPFKPEIPDIVDVQGRPVAKFATSLDYVALKLKYTTPEQLAIEARI